MRSHALQLVQQGTIGFNRLAAILPLEQLAPDAVLGSG
jgi:hypothetical protein